MFSGKYLSLEINKIRFIDYRPSSSEVSSSGYDEELLNADKVLALIKNSCEGLNAQSLTELTNAITSEDIYKNVPPEITTLITQAIKHMKENNGM